LQGKVVLFDSVHDHWLKRYFTNFGYSYDTLETALGILKNISKNWEYFFSVAQLAGKAFQNVIEISRHEELCLALHEYSAIKQTIFRTSIEAEQQS